MKQVIEIPVATHYTLKNARIPACVLEKSDLPATAQNAPDIEGCVLVDITVENGKILCISPPGNSQLEIAFDLTNRQTWPMFVDVHTHLDKGHFITRSANDAGTFQGARDASHRDRTKFWTHDDVYKRMDFGLRCAEAHGVDAIRTHLDSHAGQAEISWAVFTKLREQWKARIDLQAASLFPIDVYLADYGVKIADLVARSGGILGGVTSVSSKSPSVEGTGVDAALDALFKLATERGLNVDLHVDENSDPSPATLRNVAQAVMRNDFKGSVVCGHCCNLALQDESDIEKIISLVRDACLSIVSLPATNMYLQDRQASRTPRWRGVTLVKELLAAGVNVAVAGDNCRDAFHAYGDHDMFDTFRQAVRVLHLDHPFATAPTLATKIPAKIMANGRGRIVKGSDANFVIFNARTINELMCRSQHDRVVVRRGKRLDVQLPDYSELDSLSHVPR